MFVPDGWDPAILVQVLYGWVTDYPGYLPDKYAGILILQLFVDIPKSTASPPAQYLRMEKLSRFRHF